LSHTQAKVTPIRWSRCAPTNPPRRDRNRPRGVGPDDFDCNRSWTAFSPGDGGFEARTLSTLLFCGDAGSKNESSA